MLSGHVGPVFGAAFNADATRVVTTSFDNTARVWDLTRGGPIARLSDHAAAVNGAAFGAEGSRIVTASEDNTARLWDAGTGACRGIPDACRLVEGGGDYAGTVRVECRANHPARMP